MKGREKRPRLYIEGAFRNLTNAARDAKAVHFLQRQSFEYQEIESSLEKV
jgi:hypothetical protein